MTNLFLTTAFYSQIYPDTDVIEMSVSLALRDIESDEEINIGHAVLYFIDTFRSGFLIDADAVGQDLITVVSNLHEQLEEEDAYFGKLVVLDSIFIKKEHRNKGYGKEVVEEILNYVDLIDFDYFALLASPIEEENQVNKVKDLIRFYEQFGLEVVNDTETIMGRNLHCNL